MSNFVSDLAVMAATRRPRPRYLQRRLVVGIRYMSRAFDDKLAKVETRLPHPHSWSCDPYRAPIDIESMTHAGALVESYRRRLWRMVVEVRLFWGFAIAVWAVTVENGRHGGALRTELWIGAGVLVAWSATTSLWSSYLWDELQHRPGLAYVEIPLGVFLLAIGGGVDPAFAGYAGMTMIAPALVIGNRGIATALVPLLLTFPLSYLVYRGVGGDPMIGSVSAFKSLSGDMIGYAALAILVSAFVTILDRVRNGMGAIEGQVIAPHDKVWARSQGERLGLLRQLQGNIYIPALDEITVRVRSLVSDADPSRRDVEETLALLNEGRAKEQSVPTTLGQIIYMAERELTIGRLPGLRAVDSTTTWTPREKGPGRLLLEERRARALSDLTREAARNMANHGKGPFRIAVEVAFAENELVPGATNAVTITFANKLSKLPTSRAGRTGSGQGQSIVDRALDDLRAIPLQRGVHGDEWVLKLRFKQPTIIAFPVE